jgi:diaminopimelate decarboxylase
MATDTHVDELGRLCVGEVALTDVADEFGTPMTVVGRHCESGDEIARDVPLPADLHAGDLLAVPCTGAYHHSMASTYNVVADRRWSR